MSKSFAKLGLSELQGNTEYGKANVKKVLWLRCFQGQVEVSNTKCAHCSLV